MMNFNPGNWLKNKGLYKYLAAIPIPVFIVLIAVLTPFDNRAVPEPPWLLSILNTVFIFAIYFAVAYISAKSYLASGSLSIFLLGCGMLAFGFAALLGGWLIAAPGGINVNVTLVNIGALFGSIFHLMGAMLTPMRVNLELNSKSRKRNLMLAYPGVLILVILLAIASLQGITPPFFMQGTGPTLLRQVVLGIAAMLFAISALLFIRLYSRLKEIYLYWYSLALMLVAINLFAAFLVRTVGSPFSWAVRLPLYLGGIYFLNAIFIARRTARTRGTSIEEAVANFFREPEENFRVLVETANDAIVSFDNEGRVLLWNSAAEKIFGYNRSEAVGSILGDLIIPDSYAGIMKKEMENLTIEGSTLIRKTIETEAKRKDGQAFPVEFSVSARRTSDGWMYTSIIRDIAERKHAEEALRESEQRWATTLASIGDAVISTDIEGRITFMNAEAEALTGWTLAEASAKPVTEVFNIINEYTRLEADNPVTRVLKEGIIVGLANHTILIKRDGTEVPIDDSGAPIRDGGGKTMGVVLVFRDITERKRVADEIEELMASIKEEKDRLSALVKSIPDEVWFADANHNIVLVNPAVLKVFGGVTFDKPEVESIAGNAEVYRPDGTARPVEEAPPLRALRGEEVKDQEEIVRIPISGELRVRQVNASPVMNAAGNIIGSVAVVRDITELKKVEEALRKAHDELELRVQERTAELKEANKALLESEANYRELTESIDDLFYAMDRELRYTYWNKASEALTGISAKDAIGKSLYELFPDIKGTKAEQFYIQALKTQKPGRFESEYQLGDKKFIFEINVYPTKTGHSVISKDITEKKMFEVHLLRAQRMESIGILAGGIAHNLNNMLTPMMMSLHMLKGKFTDEQSQKLLNILEQNSHRSADLIKQVLSFSRGVEGERIPLAAKHLISEIEKIAKETFPRNIEIRTDIQKDLFTISGDATQLHQVIMNLCVNARDAMPDGGILSITASNFFTDESYARMHTEAKVGSYIVIAVSDTGIGIPPDILDRIFEPFFTTKEFGKGTGLGLSTSLAIVKSHGGFINVYSEVGKGTTFRVYLPVIKTEMQNAEEQQLELFTGHGELVLVAEDEDSVREVTISTLGKYGYSVLAANDGANAVALYAENMDKINVVLMDMMMPVMDGHASIRAIRKINPEVKIIAVSGLAEKEKLKNVADNTNAFLPKPYTAERLIKTINEVLNIK